MKLAAGLGSMILVLVLVGCGGTVSTATSVPTVIPASVPTSISTSTLVPTATAVSALAPSPTSDPTQPTAFYILESAIENLRAAPSFHVEAQISGGNLGRWTFIAADIVNPDVGRIYESWNDGLHGERDEILTIDGKYYYRPADFQVWFDAGDRRSLQRDISGFPYELDIFRTEIRDLAVENPGLAGDVGSYRLRGTATQGLAEAIGFYSAHAWSKGIAKVEMLISRDDLLPIRIEGGIDGWLASFSAEYSNFGADMGISAPEEVWDVDYLQHLWEGTLSADEMERILRVFPVEGQKCVEVDIGTGLYMKVISGDNFDEDIMRTAFWFCEGAIFSVSSDIITPRTDQIDEIVDKWDLSVLSVSPEELVEQGLQCLRVSIGLSNLFDIGNGEREPTLDELDAAAMCKP